MAALVTWCPTPLQPAPAVVTGAGGIGGEPVGDEADGDFRHHVHVARYWRTSTSGNSH